MRNANRHREEELLQEALTQHAPNQHVDTYFRLRYLEYLRWLEDGAAHNLTLYYALRMSAIILGATIPALVALDPGTAGRIVTVILGVIVAVATTVEHFLNCGHRWRHYRGSAELLKSEGWMYLGLTNGYAKHADLESGLRDFVANVERIMRDEVREYVTTIVADRKTPNSTDETADPSADPRASSPVSVAYPDNKNPA